MRDSTALAPRTRTVRNGSRPPRRLASLPRVVSIALLALAPAACNDAPTQAETAKSDVQLSQAFTPLGPCPTSTSPADSSCIQDGNSPNLSLAQAIEASPSVQASAQAPLTIAMIGIVSGLETFIEGEGLGTVTVMTASAVMNGALSANDYDVIVLGRGGVMPAGLGNVLDAAVQAGAGLLTEWNAGAGVWTTEGSPIYGPFRESDGTLFGWHPGTVDRGDCSWIAGCQPAPFTVLAPGHDIAAGLPATFTVPAMEFCFRVTGADPTLTPLVSVPDQTAPAGTSRTVIYAGSRGQGRVLYWLCDWNDNNMQDADLKTWVRNALGWLVGPANGGPVANAGGPYTGDEGSAIALSAAASSDPDNDALIYAWDLDGDSDYDDATGVAASVTFPDNGAFTVGVRATDPAGASSTASATVTVANVNPEITSITGPTGPIQLVSGTAAANIGVSSTDPGADTHTTSIACGNATVATGGVCSYAEAGVYTVTVTVTETDPEAGADSETFQYVVVYDPSAGFVTGGGWIAYDIASCTICGDLAGRADFGFVAKYQKGATAPTGNTRFEFHAGTLQFVSTSYEWLVVSGSRAQFKGVGTINGGGSYGFLLTAVDGSPDRFRIKIVDLNAADAVVFDNQMGEDVTGPAATALDKVNGNGSIVIHSK